MINAAVLHVVCTMFQRQCRRGRAIKRVRVRYQDTPGHQQQPAPTLVLLLCVQRSRSAAGKAALGFDLLLALQSPCETLSRCPPYCDQDILRHQVVNCTTLLCVDSVRVPDENLRCPAPQPMCFHSSGIIQHHQFFKDQKSLPGRSCSGRGFPPSTTMDCEM